MFCYTTTHTYMEYVFPFPQFYTSLSCTHNFQYSPQTGKTGVSL